jgi:hypothetical protein
MSTEEKEGKARNEEIENQLKRDRMAQRNEIKMLLLGKSILACKRNRGPVSVARIVAGASSAVALSQLTLTCRCW